MYRRLDPAKILVTLTRLRERVEARFPGSGLSQVSAELETIGRESVARAEWIARPHLGLRIGIVLLVVLLLSVLALAVANLPVRFQLGDFPDFVQATESGVNDLVFIGIAIFFLVRLEARRKRERALRAMHELRSLAHVIDMHQLTKDPQILLRPGHTTAASPARSMTAFELSRYLDYCSEMLALIGKIAALHGERFDDAVALAAVDQIEDLTTGLSRKIWQKISLLSCSASPGEAGLPPQA